MSVFVQYDRCDSMQFGSDMYLHSMFRTENKKISKFSIMENDHFYIYKKERPYIAWVCFVKPQSITTKHDAVFVCLHHVNLAFVNCIVSQWVETIYECYYDAFSQAKP